MKYLKSYNESNQESNTLTKDNISDIKDMFQDILDEYDIDENIMQVFKTDTYNARYNYSYVIKLGHQWISEETYNNGKYRAIGFRIMLYSPVKSDVIQPFEEGLERDINNLCKRLEMAGYDVDKKITTVRVNVIDSIRIEIKLKNELVEESFINNIDKKDTLTDSEVADIKDVFQDVVDEYEMLRIGSKYVNSTTNAIFDYFRIGGLKRFVIDIYSPYRNGVPFPFPDRSKLSIIINNFCNRIEAMGFGVTNIITAEYIKIEITHK